MSLGPEISLAAREWLMAWLLDYLEGLELEPADGTLEPESYVTQAPRIYGQFGGGRLTGRQSNLTSRPGQRHTTVMLSGQRYAIGDTKKQYTRPLQPPRGSPVVVTPMPFMPTIFFAPAELLVDFTVAEDATTRLPSWLAYQQAPGVLTMDDEYWLEGITLGGPGGGPITG